MVLLDTHVLLWMLFDDSKLSERAIEALNQRECCASIASIWEIAIKISLGKLKLPKTVREIYDECLNMGIAFREITVEACIRLQELPWIHRDPFDRIIISQAMAENLSLITHDGNIHRYDGVDIIW